MRKTREIPGVQLDCVTVPGQGALGFAYDRQAPDDPPDAPESPSKSGAAARTGARTGATSQEDRDLYPRAGGNEGYEQNDERALRSVEETNSFPKAQAHNRSVRSSVAHLDKVARLNLGHEVIDEAGTIIQNLGSPPWLYRWIPLVAAYLREASGCVSEDDIERIIYAARNPGGSAQTRNAGRLFTGGLKALIRKKRDALLGHPMFAGSALHSPEWELETTYVLPLFPAIRACLADLGVELDRRWTRPE